MLFAFFKPRFSEGDNFGNKVIVVGFEHPFELFVLFEHMVVKHVLHLIFSSGDSRFLG